MTLDPGKQKTIKTSSAHASSDELDPLSLPLEEIPAEYFAQDSWKTTYAPVVPPLPIQSMRNTAYGPPRLVTKVDGCFEKIYLMEDDEVGHISYNGGSMEDSAGSK